MSKASEWARLQKVRPKDLVVPLWKSRSAVRFWVDDNGNLVIENWQIAPQGALQVERWLRDTFGEKS